MNESEWSKVVYEASVSSRCWCFGPYDNGWSGSGLVGEDPSVDEELRQIVAMEYGLRPLPDWVEVVVEGPVRWVGFCGHSAFPQSFLDAVDAIGAQRPPALVHTCYTVDRARKHRMMDYALCLDAWLARAGPEAAAPELARRTRDEVDWYGVCTSIWDVLGERTELKELLVERMLHRTRWWLKTTVWDDDIGTEFCRDEYLGNWLEREPLIASNGNSQFRKGGFDETASPRVQKLESRLAEICQHWKWFRTVIVEFSWPCAPKAFRFMEKTLWCIGRERPVISLPSFPLDDPEDVPSFLMCEDTWPDQDAAGEWWEELLAALRGWWQGKLARGDVGADTYRRLGESTSVKRWLVRLLVRRFEVLAMGHLKGMVNPPSQSMRGKGTVAHRPSRLSGGSRGESSRM